MQSCFNLFIVNRKPLYILVLHTSPIHQTHIFGQITEGTCKQLIQSSHSIFRNTIVAKLDGLRGKRNLPDGFDFKVSISDHGPKTFILKDLTACTCIWYVEFPTRRRVALVDVKIICFLTLPILFEETLYFKREVSRIPVVVVNGLFHATVTYKPVILTCRRLVGRAGTAMRANTLLKFNKRKKALNIWIWERLSIRWVTDIFKSSRLTVSRKWA